MSRQRLSNDHRHLIVSNAMVRLALSKELLATPVINAAKRAELEAQIGECAQIEEQILFKQVIALEKDVLQSASFQQALANIRAATIDAKREANNIQTAATKVGKAAEALGLVQKAIGLLVGFLA